LIEVNAVNLGNIGFIAHMVRLIDFSVYPLHPAANVSKGIYVWLSIRPLSKHLDQKRHKEEGRELLCLLLCPIALFLLAIEREQGSQAPTELLFNGSRSGGVESPSERNIRAFYLLTSALCLIFKLGTMSFSLTTFMMKIPLPQLPQLPQLPLLFSS
jgi:hypothetical protein